MKAILANLTPGCSPSRFGRLWSEQRSAFGDSQDTAVGSGGFLRSQRSPSSGKGKVDELRGAVVRAEESKNRVHGDGGLSVGRVNVATEYVLVVVLFSVHEMSEWSASERDQLLTRRARPSRVTSRLLETMSKSFLLRSQAGRSAPSSRSK